jgi:WXXGXW repeat (2 copies)
VNRRGFFISTLALCACVTGVGEGPGAAPPQPRQEVHSIAPTPGMVWVPGGWHWNDRDWVWISGRWETAPPPAAVP